MSTKTETQAVPGVQAAKAGGKSSNKVEVVDSKKSVNQTPDKLLLAAAKQRTFLPHQKTLKLTQIKSPIGREKCQRSTLIGLGLNKLNRISVVEDTASVMGMINVVRHLITVEIN